MECLQTDRMIKFRVDTLEAVRKDLNLDKPGRIEEALDILENWVQMQPHFVKKDFSRDYLERLLITAKGLVERAKERLDKLCTYRTLMPEFFIITDIKKEFEHLKETLTVGHLPQMTPKHHRVFITKVISGNLDSTAVFNFYKYLVVTSEYILRMDYSNGYQIILDFTDGNILNVVTKVEPLELRRIMILMTEGYGSRIKAIHLITPSKMVDKLITLLKQVFSAKLANRIHSHKTVDTLSEYVPKDIMPADFGGKEKFLGELNNDWLKVICSNEFLDYMKEMNRATTDESCRHSDKFCENYIGMPGSFRGLSVD